MRNINLLKLLFLSSVCLIPFASVQAGDDVSLSESMGSRFNVDDDGDMNPSGPGLSCWDYLDTVNLKWELDPGDGATFEKYPYFNTQINKTEEGYRTCRDECAFYIAGKCVSTKTCNDFVNDFSCNVKVGNKTIGEGGEGECSKDVQLSCADVVDVDFNVQMENGVTCEGEDGSPLRYTVDPTSCKISVSGRCKLETTPTSTPTSTQTSTPTPTPTPAACEYYKGYMISSNANKKDGGEKDLRTSYSNESENLDRFEKLNEEITALNNKYIECKSIAKKIGLSDPDDDFQYQSCSDTNSVVKSKYCNKTNNYLKGTVCNTEIEDVSVIKENLSGTQFSELDFDNQDLKSLQRKICQALVDDFDSRCDLMTLGKEIKKKEDLLEEMSKDVSNDNMSNISCLNDLMTNLRNKWMNGNEYSDDAVAIVLTQRFFGKFTYQGDKNGYINRYSTKDSSRSNNTSNYGVCYSASFGNRVGGQHCLDGYFYFDKECNPVSVDTVQNECGDIGVSFLVSYEWSSPISLIFEKDYDLNSEIVFSRFNLDLGNQDNAWYAWKASEKAPLLVYDPNHTGEVKDATQLFGDWAFGGKQLASLASNSEKTNGKWDNGFEALGSLDRDYDGQLSGDELSDLALWFDANRDGVSQKGEVKTLKEVGVTALYFNGYKKDANGDLRLEVGYSRNVNGKTEQGAAIDWYEVGAPTKVELAEYYSALNGNESVSTMELKPIVSEKKGVARESQYAGIWNWYIDEGDLKDSSPSRGMFILTASGENEISGYTFTEKFFAKSPKNNLNSFVTVNKVSGVEEGGKLLFSSQIGNSFTDNRTSISKDGKTINGETVVVMGGKKTITYSWKATKFE